MEKGKAKCGAHRDLKEETGCPHSKSCFSAHLFQWVKDRVFQTHSKI